jgi:hypothetical protein
MTSVRERQVEATLADFARRELGARVGYGTSTGWWICPWCRTRNEVEHPTMAYRARCSGCGAGGHPR